MNKFENWFCGSSVWRFVTERKLLPWILSGYALGDHVLEVGAGLGATTAELQRRAGRVTSLEYDSSYVAKLAERHKDSRVTVVQGDAAVLPFPDHTIFFRHCGVGVASFEIAGAAERGVSGISSRVAAGWHVFRV